jgi:hypothetical protein
MKSHISDYFIYPLRQLLADSERYSYIYRVTGAQTVNMSCTLLLLLLLLLERL